MDKQKKTRLSGGKNLTPSGCLFHCCHQCFRVKAKRLHTPIFHEAVASDFNPDARLCLTKCICISHGGLRVSVDLTTTPSAMLPEWKTGRDETPTPRQQSGRRHVSAFSQNLLFLDRLTDWVFGIGPS